jgi:hypothetical protein
VIYFGHIEFLCTDSGLNVYLGWGRKGIQTHFGLVLSEKQKHGRLRRWNIMLRWELCVYKEG